jgi:hypothetical protein
MTFPSAFSSRVGWTDATTPMDVESLRQDFVEKLFYDQAKFPAVASANDHFQAIARVVRDRLLACWIRTVRTQRTTLHAGASSAPTDPNPGPNMSNMVRGNHKSQI